MDERYRCAGIAVVVVMNRRFDTGEVCIESLEIYSLVPLVNFSVAFPSFCTLPPHCGQCAERDDSHRDGGPHLEEHSSVLSAPMDEGEAVYQ